jgi:spermidine/putrescine transport system substrate-binding protein
LVSGALALAILVSGCGQVVSVDPTDMDAMTDAPVDKQITYASQIGILAHGDLIDPVVLSEFTTRFGTRLRVQTYSNYTDLLRRVQEKGQFDLVLAPGPLIDMLTRAKETRQMATPALTNQAFLDPSLNSLNIASRHQFAVPYFWRTVGLGYNSLLESNVPTSWGDLLDPDKIPEHDRDRVHGRLVLLNDHRTVIGTALIYLGHSPNTLNAVEIRNAAELLKRQRPLLATNDNHSAKHLVSGTAHMAQVWSSQLAAASHRSPKLRFIVPSEGAIVFIDYWAVLGATQKAATAEKLIEYFLQPEIAARLSNHSHCASAVRKARSYVRREIFNGPSYALPNDKAHSFSLESVDAATDLLYEQAWKEIRQ